MVPSPIPIPLATLKDGRTQFASPPPLSSKESFGSLPPPASSRPRRRLTLLLLNTVFWAAFPMLLFLGAIATLGAALFQTSHPFLSISEVGGTGQADFMILNSCSVAPNSTARHCTRYSLNADFTPTLAAIAPGLPGFSVMYLPFRSAQSQGIFVASFAILIVAFILYLHVWTLAYFPDIRLPRFMTSFIRNYPKRFFEAAGALSFVAMYLLITIGIGYRYLLLSTLPFFNEAQYVASLANKIGVDGASVWTSSEGNGVNFVWVACACAALSALACQVSIHQHMDERIERYEQ